MISRSAIISKTNITELDVTSAYKVLALIPVGEILKTPMGDISRVSSDSYSIIFHEQEVKDHSEKLNARRLLESDV